MEEQDARLVDLIESTSFEALSEEEKRFVLKHLTEAEYTLQRKVLGAVSDLEYPEPDPLPLVLKPEKKGMFSRTIPLYQALIGAACLLLVFFVVQPGKSRSLNLNFSENPLQVSFTNPATSVQIIHDTITKEIPVLRSASSIIRDTVTIVQYVLKQPENRMLEAGNTLVMPPLNEQLLENKSLAFKDDQTARFLPQITFVNTMK
ncbi:hypothetical protein [Fluviicola sp.]|uniref:hypothetical protein n=1 Tax=Fluviicola sp. TaxID=1917219 RepID=UPI0031D0EF25